MERPGHPLCFRLHPLSERLPDYLDESGHHYQALSPADRERVRIAFISVDTHGDTPMVLQSYLSYFGPTFVGLTGSKEDIDRVTGAYGASYAFVHTPGDPPENYNVMHSSNLYLVNTERQ